MATNRTVTVKTSAGDYSTWDNAIDGEVAGLVALDRQLTIELYNSSGTNGADTEAVHIDSATWTSSATCYIDCVVASGYRHAGVWTTGKYHLLANSGWAGNTFSCNLQYTRVRYVQMRYSSGGGGAIVASVLSATGSAGVWFYSCIFSGNAAATYGLHCDAKVYAKNCLSYDSTAVQIRCYDDSGGSRILNCTAVGGTHGIYSGFVAGAACVFTNCLGYGTSTADFFQESGTNPTVTYCASEDATSDDWSGAGCRVSQTFTFTDAAGKNFLRTSADAGAKDYGTSLAADTFPVAEDVIDTARPQGSAYDIGFDEVIVAVTGHPMMLRGCDVKGLRQWQPQTGRCFN